MKSLKEYGEVLGLKAPPLNNPAPEFFTSFATSVICSFVSIEHGPAITYGSFHHQSLLHLHQQLYRFGWNFLLAFLYGS